MGRKIAEYARTSGLMNIRVTYGDEEFDFNLFQELAIDENIINHEAQVQPSSYSFLNMLHKKLIRASKEADRKVDKKYHQLWLKYKKTKTDAGRAPDKETIKAMIITNESYQMLLDDLKEAEDQAWAIEACVRGFEQRVNILQTISANIRKEK